jgi:hypothetical protein
MAGAESKQVLSLLQELSMLKELDGQYQTGAKTESEQEAHLERQQRHQEIAEEIKALAVHKKSGADPSKQNDSEITS